MSESKDLLPEPDPIEPFVVLETERIYDSPWVGLRLDWLELEDGARQGLAVDGARSADAGEGIGDGGHRARVRGQQVVDRPVGVVRRHAGAAETLGGPRLAHADGAGQAEDHHGGSLGPGIEPVEDVAA